MLSPRRAALLERETFCVASPRKPRSYRLCDYMPDRLLLRQGPPVSFDVRQPRRHRALSIPGRVRESCGKDDFRAFFLASRRQLPRATTKRSWRTGGPILDIVELFFTEEQGVPDWYVTNKLPRSATGAARSSAWHGHRAEARGAARSAPASTPARIARRPGYPESVPPRRLRRGELAIVLHVSLSQPHAAELSRRSAAARRPSSSGCASRSACEALQHEGSQTSEGSPPASASFCDQSRLHPALPRRAGITPFSWPERRYRPQAGVSRVCLGASAHLRVRGSSRPGG